MASDVFQQYDESRSFGGKYRLVQLQVRVREAHSVKPLEVGGKRGDSVSVSVSETVTHTDTHRHTHRHTLRITHPIDVLMPRVCLFLLLCGFSCARQRYPLQQISCPVLMLYGGADRLTDILWMKGNLPMHSATG